MLNPNQAVHQHLLRQVKILQSAGKAETVDQPESRGHHETRPHGLRVRSHAAPPDRAPATKAMLTISMPGMSGRQALGTSSIEAITDAAPNAAIRPSRSPRIRFARRGQSNGQPDERLQPRTPIGLHHPQHRQ